MIENFSIVIASVGQPPDQPQIAIPLLLRLPVAAAIVIWGALTDRKWTVPLAAALAMPVLWIAAFSVLAAVFAVDRPALAERQQQALAAAAAAPVAATPAAGAA